MKIERAKKGTEVYDKLNGKMYQITEVSRDANGKIDAACAAEMIYDEDTDETTLSENSVTIAEANALAFRVIKDAKPDTVATGFTVEYGKLFKDGNKLESGELEFAAVVSEHIGSILLAVKAGDKIDLMTYEPDRDRFRKVGSGGYDRIPELLWQNDDKENAMFALQTTQDIEVEAEDGSKEKKTVFGSTTLLFYDNESKRLTNVYHTQAHFLLKQALYTDSPDGKDVWFPYDETGVQDEVPTALETREWARFALYENMDECGTIVMPGQLHATWSYMYRGYTVHNGEKLMVTSEDIEIKSPAVAKIGDKALIDVTRKDDTYRLTFSDKEYHFTTLVSKKTRDRGLIVTIE